MSTLTPPNAFEPTFLEHLQAGGGEPLTAAEAELLGPWKQEPVPGHPGAVAVLSSWESQEEGDVPEAVFRHEETAASCAALLPLVGREPLFHLSEVPDPDPRCPLPGGYPLIATFGEQGPVVVEWLRHYHPEIVEALHLVESLLRLPLRPRPGQRGGWRRGAGPGGPLPRGSAVGFRQGREAVAGAVAASRA